MTEAEKIFWAKVRGRKFRNLKFRRQQVVEGFVVDFYYDSLRLFVEIDGAVHGTEAARKHDAERDKALKMHGLTMLRFTNDEVVKDVDEVLEKISACIDSVEANCETDVIS